MSIREYDWGLIMFENKLWVEPNKILLLQSASVEVCGTKTAYVQKLLLADLNLGNLSLFNSWIARMRKSEL